MNHKSSDHIVWGGLTLPASVCDNHFCVVGCSKSGKTVTLRMLMQSVLGRVRPGSGHRAIVYDVKGEWLPLLYGMDIDHSLITTIYPFDPDGYAWDIASDIVDPRTVNAGDVISSSSAKTLVNVIVPEMSQKEPFFEKAARNILASTFTLLNKYAGRDWTFQDVLILLRDRTLLKTLLERTDATRDIVENYFSPPGTFNNIMTTLDTVMRDFEPVAACWSHAAKDRYLTAEQWVRGSSILVLRTDAKNKATLDPINRVFFGRIVQELLDLPELGHENVAQRGDTWVFVDEASTGGKLEGLDRLLLMGRSKGACLVLGFQDIEEMREVYGERIANALVAQAKNLTVLRLESPETRRWAESVFGHYEGIEFFVNKSSTYGSGGQLQQTGRSVHQQRVARPVVLASEFGVLPLASEGVVHGYHIVPEIGAYKYSCEFASQVKEPRVVQPKVRPAEHQRLQARFSADDLRRLKIAQFSEQGSVVRRSRRTTGNDAATDRAEVKAWLDAADLFTEPRQAEGSEEKEQ